jgi:hypothetical protein
MKLQVSLWQRNHVNGFDELTSRSTALRWSASRCGLRLRSSKAGSSLSGSRGGIVVSFLPDHCAGFSGICTVRRERELLEDFSDRPPQLRRAR